MILTFWSVCLKTSFCFLANIVGGCSAAFSAIYVSSDLSIWQSIYLQMSTTFWSICLKIRDELLFLGKHCLESVQLSLQLFNRDLTSTLWGRGVLGYDNDCDCDCDAKGRVPKKNPYLLWSFAKPPLGPPPGMVFSRKKNYPYFFFRK